MMISTKVQLKIIKKGDTKSYEEERRRLRRANESTVHRC